MVIFPVTWATVPAWDVWIMSTGHGNVVGSTDESIGAWKIFTMQGGICHTFSMRLLSGVV